MAPPKDAISFIEGLIDGNYQKRFIAFNEYKRAKLQYGKRNNTPEEEELKTLVDEQLKKARNIFDKLQKKYKDVTEADFEESVKEGFTVTNSLVRFVIFYMHTFEEMKRDKGIISFSDMEHMALEILVNYSIYDCLELVPINRSVKQ